MVVHVGLMFCFLPVHCCGPSVFGLFLLSGHAVVYVGLISCLGLGIVVIHLGLIVAFVCPCCCLFICFKSLGIGVGHLGLVVAFVWPCGVLWGFAFLGLPVHWCGPSWFDCCIGLAMLWSMWFIMFCFCLCIVVVHLGLVFAFVYPCCGLCGFDFCLSLGIVVVHLGSIFCLPGHAVVYVGLISCLGLGIVVVHLGLIVAFVCPCCCLFMCFCLCIGVAHLDSLFALALPCCGLGGLLFFVFACALLLSIWFFFVHVSIHVVVYVCLMFCFCLGIVVVHLGLIFPSVLQCGGLCGFDFLLLSVHCCGPS